MRPGLDFRINGVPFQLVRWEFNEDGWAGHIHFKIPDGIYEPGCNNGAYYRKDPDPENPSVPNAHMATPCMPDGEDFTNLPFHDIIHKAARYIDLNLTRLKGSDPIHGDHFSISHSARSKWRSILSGMPNITLSPAEAASLEAETGESPAIQWNRYRILADNHGITGCSVLFSAWKTDDVLLQLETDGFPDDLTGATISGWPLAKFVVTTKAGIEYHFASSFLQTSLDKLCPYQKSKKR